MGLLKFTLHTKGLKKIAAKLKAGCTEAEHVVAAQAMKDTSPFVPFDNGILDKSARVEGNTIIYPGPYARYLYHGKLMIDSDTGSSWAPKGGTKALTDRDIVFSKEHHGNAQSHWFEASKVQNLEKWQETAAEAIKNEFKK